MMGGSAASTIDFAVPDIAVEHRPDGSRILRSRQALEPHARCVGVYLQHWAERRARSRVPCRARRRRLAPHHLWRGVAGGAVDRTGAARPRALGRAPGRHPLRECDRPCAADPRRAAGRRAGGAGLGRLLAPLAGLRQAAAHRRAGAARPHLRARRHRHSPSPWQRSIFATPSWLSASTRHRGEARRSSRIWLPQQPATTSMPPSPPLALTRSRRSSSPRARRGCRRVS